MTPDKTSDAVTLGDRIASAVVAAIAASITLGVLYVFLIGKAFSGPPDAMFDALIFKMLLSLVLFAALAGFSLGSARMAEAMGYMWGTSSDDLLEQRWFKTLMALLGMLLAAWAVILWRHF